MDNNKNSILISSLYGRRPTSVLQTKLHPTNTFVPDSSEREKESDSEEGTYESNACNNDNANGNHNYDGDQSSNAGVIRIKPKQLLLCVGENVILWNLEDVLHWILEDVQKKKASSSSYAIQRYQSKQNCPFPGVSRHATEM